VGGAEVALAVVCVVEVPGLAGLDQLAAAPAGDLACGDQWFELAAAGDLGAVSRAASEVALDTTSEAAGQ
jgi:hypothetical protein